MKTIAILTTAFLMGCSTIKAPLCLFACTVDSNVTKTVKK